MEFKDYWFTEGIRLLGNSQENHIPDVMYRCKHAWETSAKLNAKSDDASYEQGRNDMREELVAFIYEVYLFNKKWDTKGEIAPVIKSIIKDIRYNEEIEHSLKNPNSFIEPSEDE